MFGEVIGKLDSWFGRSFLIASFFPWFIFAAVNIALLQVVRPDLTPSLTAYFSGKPFGSVEAVATVLAIVAVVAYLSDPLAPFLTRCLEGLYLPPVIARWFASDQFVRQRNAATAVDAAQRELGALKINEKALIASLDDARDQGVFVRTVVTPATIVASRAGIDALLAKQRHQECVRLADLRPVVAALTTALKDNCADIDSLAVRHADIELKSRDLQEQFLLTKGIIGYAIRRWDNEYDKAQLEKQTAFSSTELPPTRCGNEAAALRDLVEQSFKIDFEFFWPIFVLNLQKSDKLSDSIVRSKQQLDFFVRTFWLTVLFTAIWLPGLTVQATFPYGPLLVGTAGLAASAVWLEIVYASYRSFAELVRGVIILNRFDLLKALHMALPDTWQAEQALWTELAHQLKWRSSSSLHPIEYKHAEK